MKYRRIPALLTLGLACAAVFPTTDATAAVTGVTCKVSAAGWREDIKALRLDCDGKMYFAREALANSTCGLKTSMDAIKMFQTTANAALLSGNSILMFYDKQTGCNTTDLVPREMFLLNN